MQDSKVIVALDYNDKHAALEFVGQVTPDACKLKVGKEMFTLFGPDFVKELVGRGFDVFLDLKFHDIPNTVAKACSAAAELGVWMVNVHASGGNKMMEAAKDALDKCSHRPKLIAVTVLTSMDVEQLQSIGITTSIQAHVEHLAALTKQSGLDGVVCSAMEASSLKAQLGKEFQLVTPGIRPVGSAAGDQSRIVTPEQAVADGVDYMVIGRPITQSANPLQTLQQINQSIA
ncbi:orotidine-5'-phosphate decarboxylase [Planctobacterium marinum]|uniref:orotidine-5'-phosphate decarboxylase n=1 Tax=Planctobacterium marinum TaxID=1631968 RepID=UPI001E36FFE9|nr:orotidine-5'-phosphate decarboxylase [Planctobacterium marinum]MCC2604141.1 orotidine-5'-phosphate decarboxylase [Planctobacterium marinum]